MPKKALEKLELATFNMSVPVMMALLDRIHSRLRENGELNDVADHVGIALNILCEKPEEVIHLVEEVSN